jgi:predicted regulator of Ras-like GTPase activity (Roadblock/LC7/MglB family)
MDNILVTLQELDGVNGVFVADSTGKLLGFRAHSVYDADLLQRASKLVANVIDSVKLLQEDWNAITAQYTDGKLLIRNVSGKDLPAARSAILVVIADSQLNVSFAGVAVRVAVAKLKALLESNVELSSSTVGRPNEVLSVGSTSTASPQVAVPTHATHTAIAPNPVTSSRLGGSDVAASGLSWSSVSGSSSMTGSGITVADAASSEFLTTCTKALARAVGPMAKFYVKDAVRKLFPDKPFSRDNSGVLIEELVKSIKKPEEVTKFRNQMRSIV